MEDNPEEKKSQKGSPNRVPREKMAEQNERLTNKHIQTLQFVQEVVNENKILKKRVAELEESQLNCDDLHKQAEESKEKIKTIQEQYLKRADEINAMMAEKHRGEMMQVVQEKLDQEKKYCEEIIQLRTDITQLEKTNADLMDRIHELSQSQEKMEVLNAEIGDLNRIIADLRMEVDALKSENEQITGEKQTQFSQLQNLQALKLQNESLSQDLKSLAGKNMELAHKVSKLQAELKESNSSKEQAELIDSLKNKLSKLHKERSVGAEKEEFYQKQIGDLKYEVEKLKESVQNAEVTKDRVLEEYYKVHRELQYLKRNYSNDAQQNNFKEFVKLKREVGLLKEENQELRKGLKGVSAKASSSSLPMLKFESDSPIMKINTDKKMSKARKGITSK